MFHKIYQCFSISKDILWNPVNKLDTGEIDRKYLRLTYPESSAMEYPNEWKTRMKIWDEVMSEL